MMQGDQYQIPIEIETSTGVASGDTFADVEITLGRLTKTMSSGQIKYSKDQQAFMFPLTQQETFRFAKGPHRMQVRVKLFNGNVLGGRTDGVDVIASLSREVL